MEMNREEIRRAVLEALTLLWKDELNEDELYLLEDIQDKSEVTEVVHEPTGQIFHLFYVADGDCPFNVWATESPTEEFGVELEEAPWFGLPPGLAHTGNFNADPDYVWGLFNRPADGTETPHPMMTFRNGTPLPYNPPTPN